MFDKQLSKIDDEPPLLRGKKWIIALNIMIFCSFPVLAQEAEPEPNYYTWDYGTITAPIILETVKSAPVEEPTELKPVKYYGNGTCVPYARQRTGIDLYGWAGLFLDKASSSEQYVVTEVPMPGCIVVTNEGGGHVAVVEEVVAGGILVSEQNYAGLYVVTERKIPFESELIEGYIRAK